MGWVCDDNGDDNGLNHMGTIGDVGLMCDDIGDGNGVHHMVTCGGPGWCCDDNVDGNGLGNGEHSAGWGGVVTATATGTV